MRRNQALSIGIIFLVITTLGVGISLAQDEGDEEPFSNMYNTLPVSPDPLAGNLSSPDKLFEPNQSEDAADVSLSPSQTYNASLRIAGTILKPRTSDVEWRVGGQGGCIFAESGNAATWWSASVEIPEGSTAKYFRMYTNDTNVSEDTRAYFTVYDLYGDVESEWGVSSSGSYGEYYWTTDEFTHTIDYDYYSYVVNWQPSELGSDMQLCGIRIFYHTPPGAIALPMILK